MLWILCLALCSLLTPARADPGALVRLGMDVLSRGELVLGLALSFMSLKSSSVHGILQGRSPTGDSSSPAVMAEWKNHLRTGANYLKVKDVLLPIITMNFMPGVGVFQCVSTGMTITGKSFMGGNMEIIVVLNITATNRLLQDEETGLPMFKSEGCEVILVSVKTNLPSNMLPKVVNKFLDSTLHKVLPGLMCPAIDAVLVYVNKKWASLNAPMPVGQMGTVQYVLTSVPTITASYIQVDFSPVVQQPKGNTIQLADAGGAAFPEDYAEGSSQLLLSAAFLTAELALLQKFFDVKVKDTMIGELPPQTTVTLAGFIPKVAEAYPKSKPLVTKIRINKSPKVTMKTGKSLLHLHGTLEMFAARRRGKPPVSLFVLETHFNLKIQYSVHEDRLQMTTSLDRLKLKKVGKTTRPFRVPEKLWMKVHDIVQEAVNKQQLELDMEQQRGEISPGYSLEGLMLKLKLQYSGHLM
ncbi:hypothetical protein FD754_014298 [Muntiacus muntjak]|uniref:Lipid-binding serum glycoprotein C-terminal domain-containing protein n=1 Tax=Muntiacus muntjak TaxID=9888 RepID=A0A5N3VJK3_MUNMU|nr:hypothetical protein FD754_014298 [Muntiacus muntjak]